MAAFEAEMLIFQEKIGVKIKKNLYRPRMATHETHGTHGDTWDTRDARDRMGRMGSHGTLGHMERTVTWNARVACMNLADLTGRIGMDDRCSILFR